MQARPHLPKRPLVIGLTGGICSGKTNICKKLEALGAGIVDCDALGHRAYARHTAAYHKVLEAFGRDILDGDGNIDRKKLGAKVFGNKVRCFSSFFLSTRKCEILNTFINLEG